MVHGPHGPDGAVSIKVLSEVPGRFDPGRTLLSGDGSPLRISASRETGPDTRLLWLDGFRSRNQAATLTGAWLSAQTEAAPLAEEGVYFHYQLLGMRVCTEDGEALGEIAEILETGSNDVYIVRGPDGGDLLLPATAQVVRSVDVEAGMMTVRLLEGLR